MHTYYRLLKGVEIYTISITIIHLNGLLVHNLKVYVKIFMLFLSSSPPNVFLKNAATISIKSATFLSLKNGHTQIQTIF